MGCVGARTSVWASTVWVIRPREPTGRPVGKNECLPLSLVKADAPAAGRIALLHLCWTKGIFKDSRLPVGSGVSKIKHNNLPNLALEVLCVLKVKIDHWS